MKPGNRIDRTILPNGKVVSTAYVCGVGFETMVFPSESDWEDLDCRRYASPEDARVGHAEVVAEWGAR